MSSEPDVAGFAHREGVHNESYPLTMSVLQAFRSTQTYQREVLDKLSLGADRIRDLGNLYTAAMPAWLAAGLEQALEADMDLTHQELLTLGYGSGDAAEVIPFYVAPRWREATARIRFTQALSDPIDLTEAQYVALHDGHFVSGLEKAPHDEFVIAGVGQHEERHFQDIGIEYYRFAQGRQGTKAVNG
jgi:hydroxymethylglutaryl-CoA synthase